MEAIVLRFKVTPEDFRRMSYFNTFSLRKMQSFFVAFVWFGSIILLLLKLLGIIEPTEIMFLCFIIVSLSIPVMVLSVELGVGRFKRAAQEGDASTRTVTLSEKGIKLGFGDGTSAPIESWSAFIAAYETRFALIVYRDANRTILIPKSGISSEKLTAARCCLQTALGKAYRVR